MKIQTAILLLLAAGSVFGQPVTFDAVAIRPTVAGARGGGFNIAPGRIQSKNTTLKDLVKFAWNLQDYQLSGGPGWLDGDRFDVTATFPAGTTNQTRGQMMQTMLADRFGLLIHKESKELSGYALIVGKNGAKLTPSVAEQPAMMLGRTAAGLRTLNGGKVRMDGLASILADLLSKPVENKTQLDGIYDFELQWMPDSMTDITPKGGAEKVETSADQTAGPSLFTALQETLGLKLETGKVRVETVVIDRANKPSDN